MKKTTLLTMAVMLFCGAAMADTAPQGWDRIEKRIRDCVVTKVEAKAFIASLRPLLDLYFTANGGKESGAFVFPVKGYGPSAIGGTKGEGYVRSRYDFFDGNRHSGHPAQDIFIKDNNQDLLDDRTHRAVAILSASDGVVVSSNSGWKPGSEIRGGNYIYVYDPAEKGIYYYAHMDKVVVSTGNIVKAGQFLGTMGRSGKNAAPKRSPTHLHFMYLSYKDDGSLVPENTYSRLVTGRRPAPAAAAAHVTKTAQVAPAHVTATAAAVQGRSGVSGLVLQGAKKWIQHRVVYRNEYRVIPYPGGDVPAEEGVCTDVVIRAFREAGYDLQKLVHEDEKANFEKYPLRSIWRQSAPDSNIDHRRCPNLMAYFDRFAIKLPLGTSGVELEQWKPGDIVFWSMGFPNSFHTGIISDRKNGAGIPLVIHNYPTPGYACEEDVLRTWKIVRHYRYE